MGVPVSDHEKLKHLSGKIIEFMATPKPPLDVLLGSQDALLAMQDYFRSIFKLRRSDPRDDLISILVTVEEAGDRLTEEELISTCVTVLIGGHETTTNLISSGMLANRHLSFGYGPHFCVGAPLARLEAPMAINALLRCLPHPEIATDELIWKNEMFRGLERLPVSFG